MLEISASIVEQSVACGIGRWAIIDKATIAFAGWSALKCIT